MEQFPHDSLDALLRAFVTTVGSQYDSHLVFLAEYISQHRAPLLDGMASRASGRDLCDKLRQQCEKIYFEVQLDLFQANLENARREGRLTMLDVDRMPGIAFESLLARIYEAMGYDVTLTKAAGDQGADLVMKRFSETTVVQAKRYSGTVGNKAIQEVIAARSFYNCEKAIVVTNSRYTDAAKELAHRAAVELVGRGELQQMVDALNATPQQGERQAPS